MKAGVRGGGGVGGVCVCVCVRVLWLGRAGEDGGRGAGGWKRRPSAPRRAKQTTGPMV